MSPDLIQWIGTGFVGMVVSTWVHGRGVLEDRREQQRIESLEVPNYCLSCDTVLPTAFMEWCDDEWKCSECAKNAPRIPGEHGKLGALV